MLPWHFGDGHFRVSWSKKVTQSGYANLDANHLGYLQLRDTSEQQY